MQIDNNIPEVARRQIEHIAEVCERIKPLVVIRCITYNHEPFLRDALEGFVMQKADFPFVAVVHDDASTDGTAAILREYVEKYPDIILPIFEEENQYSKRNGTLGRIIRAAKVATDAKYIALCEGDDYWTYEHKLQKQVDFLESHPNYSLVFHNAPIKYLDGSLNFNFYNIDGTREYSANEILIRWTIPTVSVVYRREGIDDDPIRFNKKFKYGDNVLFLTAAKHGRLYGIDEPMSVYRQQIGSMVNSVGPIAWAEINIEHVKELDKTFSFMLEKNLCKQLIANNYIYLIRRHRTIPTKVLTYACKALRDVPIQFLHTAINSWIFRKEYSYKPKCDRVPNFSKGNNQSQQLPPPLISVIVPVYNKKKRVALCLESIINQAYGAFEIIAIDDGSTDGSGIIIDQMTKFERRLSVIHKPNGGVSSARNTGIDIAQGQYLCFVDADDTIAPDFLKNLIEAAQPEDDIVSESPYSSEKWENEAIAQYIDAEGRAMQGTSVWGKLYKNNLVKENGIRFDTNIRFGEDTEFNLTLWPLCKSIKTVKSSNYNYYYEEGRTWELSVEEICNKIRNLKEKYSHINEVFHSDISIERDVSITLSLYRFSDLMDDEERYLRLYAEVYQGATKESLYNDSRCSPLIRGITVAKNQIRVNPSKVKLLLKELSAKYGMNFLKIKYPYRTHRIIGLLLGLRLPLVAYMLLKNK